MTRRHDEPPLEPGETRYYCDVCGDWFASIVKAERCCEKRATLRDKFAMAALTGLLADSRVDDTPTKLSQSAYKLADAMLVDRNKT